MAARRAPLADVPNAINSPFRTLTTAANGKRTRTQAGEQQDPTYGQPPTKKQVIEVKNEGLENVDPRTRDGVAVLAQDKLDEPFGKPSRGTIDRQPTAFEKKLAAAKERRPTASQRVERPQKASADNLDSIRQWQRHYRRQFPQFVFYLDGVSEDIRARAVRQLQHLGAREEKFFSKAVTHVVTTRAIPAEASNTSPDDDQTTIKREDAYPATIAPSVLAQDQRRTTSLLDASIQRRVQPQSHDISRDVGLRRMQPQGADVLTRARALGIKIWALEKLQRILKTMLETDTSDQAVTQDPRAPVTHSRTVVKPNKDADLEQLLRNEKVNGPADRDMTVATQDMVTFRGFYIYVHDMNEKTKPVLVRDYDKPASKDQGKWPQFRLTPAGRCPFLEDPSYTKKLLQEDRQAEAKAKHESQRLTRATSALEQRSIAAPGVLAERQTNLRRSPRKHVQENNDDLAKPLDPPKLLPSKRTNSGEEMPPLFGSTQVNMRGLPRMVGGEPVASGLQQSNVTSAIRSQIVSSTISSTAPGMYRRVGDSKEVSALKRKVLERGASVHSQQSVPSSYMNDMRAAINDDQGPPPRAAKRKAQETLGVLNEEDEDGVVRRKSRKPAPKKKKASEKEPKAGYCENCRDKFEDFDEHVLSRKHRKFGATLENWKELDSLLVELKRPHKRQE